MVQSRSGDFRFWLQDGYQFGESPVFFNWISSTQFSMHKDELAIFSRNFSKLTNQFPWRLAINYPLLLRSFGGQIPGNFFEIFPLINSVTIDGTRLAPGELDPNKLIGFLNQCRGLDILKLLDCPLSIDFYRRLPAIRPADFITNLEIRQSEAVELEIEIAKFQNLMNFQLTGSHLSLQMVNQMFRQNNLFGPPCFRYFQKNSDLAISLFKRHYKHAKPSLFRLIVEKGDYVKKLNSVRDYSQVIHFLSGDEHAKDCLLL